MKKKDDFFAKNSDLSMDSANMFWNILKWMKL
jgi:hypothetical protein